MKQPTHSDRRGLILAAALLATSAAAQTVPDPTRPMAALRGEPADALPAKPARYRAAAAPTPLAGPRLQSVQISRGGAASALLDGRIVRVGERLGELTVTAIDRNGLTLSGPRGTQRLSLLHGIRQTASRDAPPAITTLATGTPQDAKP